MQSGNPFRYGAPVEAESFCDRREELAVLTSRMRSHIHAFVLSPRRYGKTSLLLEAGRRVRHTGGRVGYANLLLATTEEEVAATILQAVVSEVLRPIGRARRSLEDVLSHLRVAPRVMVSPDGSISVSLDTAPGIHSPADTLSDAVALLESEGDRRPASLVLDEFQQIAEVGRRGMGGVFKALADQARHTSLVFSGSHLAVMQRLTRDRGAPLLGMGESLRIGVVPEPEMVAHLCGRAAAGGKSLTADDARRLYRLAGAVPNDVQWLAHAAFEAAGGRPAVTAGDIDAGLAAVVARQASTFAERYEALSPSQQRVVKALARAPRTKIYAKEFLDAVRVANANAVTTALRALTDRELVRNDGGTWSLASPFLRAWLLHEMGEALPTTD